MGPQNTLIGNFSVDVPEMKVDEKTLIEEKKMARYSKSKEFKKIVEYCQSRIEFYQKYLPNGLEVGATEVTAEDWRVANRVVMEFNLLMNMYETAAQAVKERKCIIILMRTSFVS